MSLISKVQLLSRVGTVKKINGYSFSLSLADEEGMSFLFP